MAAIYNQFSPFDDGAEPWTSYKERLDQFFLANDIIVSTAAGADNTAVLTKKRAVLLTVIGVKTSALLRSIIAPVKPDTKTYDELTDILTKHFEPIPSEIVERCKFYKRDRKTGESVAIYVATLRQKAEFCNFGNTLDTMLRDRLVCGINNEAVQKRLLAETALDIKKAITIAQSLETVEKDALDIKSQQDSGQLARDIFNCNGVVHESSARTSEWKFLEREMATHTRLDIVEKKEDENEDMEKSLHNSKEIFVKESIDIEMEMVEEKEKEIDEMEMQMDEIEKEMEEQEMLDEAMILWEASQGLLQHPYPIPSWLPHPEIENQESEDEGVGDMHDF